DNRPVLDSIIRYAPASIELAIVATLLSVILGIGLGIYSAANRGRTLDGALRVSTIFGRAIPSFWLALLLQILFFGTLGWFPDGARIDLMNTPEPSRITGMFLVDS